MQKKIIKCIVHNYTAQCVISNVISTILRQFFSYFLYFIFNFFYRYIPWQWKYQFDFIFIYVLILVFSLNNLGSTGIFIFTFIF